MYTSAHTFTPGPRTYFDSTGYFAEEVVASGGLSPPTEVRSPSPTAYQPTWCEANLGRVVVRRMVEPDTQVEMAAISKDSDESHPVSEQDTTPSDTVDVEAFANIAPEAKREKKKSPFKLVPYVDTDSDNESVEQCLPMTEGASKVANSTDLTLAVHSPVSSSPPVYSSPSVYVSPPVFSSRSFLPSPLPSPVLSPPLPVHISPPLPVHFSPHLPVHLSPPLPVHFSPPLPVQLAPEEKWAEETENRWVELGARPKINIPPPRFVAGMGSRSNARRPPPPPGFTRPAPPMLTASLFPVFSTPPSLASRISTPHISTPHISTPHISTPHISTPHISTPHVSTPHVSTAGPLPVLPIPTFRSTDIRGRNNSGASTVPPTSVVLPATTPAVPTTSTATSAPPPWEEEDGSSLECWMSDRAISILMGGQERIPLWREIQTTYGVTIEKFGSRGRGARRVQVRPSDQGGPSQVGVAFRFMVIEVRRLAGEDSHVHMRRAPGTR